MSVLSLRIDGTIAIVESITSAIANAFSDNVQSKITTPAIACLPAARRKKVLEIRRQLAEGTYDIDDRLDAILEQLLTDIAP